MDENVTLLSPIMVVGWKYQYLVIPAQRPKHKWIGEHHYPLSFAPTFSKIPEDPNCPEIVRALIRVAAINPPLNECYFNLINFNNEGEN